MTQDSTIIWNSKPINYDYVLVVLITQSKFVFVKNKKRKWEFPGGKREEDETIFDVAKREAYEEAGAIISDIKIAGYYTLLNRENVVITISEALYFEEIPELSEIETLKITTNFLDESELSFSDGIFEKIFNYVKGMLYEH